MNSIFANKELLKKEYQKIFLELLADLNQLQKCIRSRYDKKITNPEIRIFFEKDDHSLKAFLTETEEGRIKYFFGSYLNPHEHDAQVRTLDRFILDCIHFEIIGRFIKRVNEEYLENQIEIDNLWLNESDFPEDLGSINPLHLIHGQLGKTKDLFYQDLNFPKDKSIQLFTLNENQIVPNPTVFAKWLPEPVPMYRTLLIKLNNPIPAGLVGAALGALCGLYLGPVGLGVGAAIGATIGMACQITVECISNSKSKLSPNDKENIKFDGSHSVMVQSMPSQSNLIQRRATPAPHPGKTNLNRDCKGAEQLDAARLIH